MCAGGILKHRTTASSKSFENPAVTVPGQVSRVGVGGGEIALQCVYSRGVCVCAVIFVLAALYVLFIIV